METHDIDRKKLIISIYIPALFVAILGLIRLLETALNVEWYKYSIEPRTVKGLQGIIFAPLLHADWEHYFSNAVALLVLGSVAIYTYRLITYRVVLWIWLIDGLGVWLLGRDSYHLGASGLIYGLASFLFFSGILRKNRSLWALSLFVIMVYGSMIWGMFPYLEHLSWEAHLFGFLSGAALSLYYRKQGPQDDKLPDWYHEEDIDEEIANQNIPPQLPSSIDPLFPRAPDISPRVTTPHQPDPEEQNKPIINFRYDYRKNSGNN